MAAEAAALDLTRHWAGYLGLFVFAVTYLTVMAEERLHIRKSQPVIMAAGVIWALIAVAHLRAGDTTTAAEALRHSIAEYGELFLFILVAMTFVNTMEERQVFDALRAGLVRKRLSFRQVFWVTGLMSFFMSSQLDNLTTALVMGPWRSPWGAAIPASSCWRASTWWCRPTRAAPGAPSATSPR
ncbi:MAG: sodium:proton antiporter NhaD [Gemmatimonadota bacterium]